MNLYEKLVELKACIAQEGLNKDKKGFNYTYVTGNQILTKIVNKMNELKLLLVPSSTVGSYEQYDYVTSKKVDKTDFIVKGEMSYTWINAENPEEQFTSSWAYYGQQEDVSKAYGSGLTYSERYYLLKFFGVPTDQDEPEERDNSGYAKKNNYNKTNYQNNRNNYQKNNQQNMQRQNNVQQQGTSQQNAQGRSNMQQAAQENRQVQQQKNKQQNTIRPVNKQQLLLLQNLQQQDPIIFKQVVDSHKVNNLNALNEQQAQVLINKITEKIIK